MAITIQTTFTVEGAQAVTTATAQTTSAFKAIQDQLKQMESATTATTSKMITGLKQLSQQGTVTATGQGALGKALLQTGQAAGATTAQLKQFQQAAASANTATSSFATSTSGVLTSLKNLAAGFGVVLGVQGLIGFTKSVIEAGIAQERLMLSLKGALGSAQAAGEAYAFVEGVANRLGVGLLTAVDSFAKLSAATQGTVVQGQQTRDLFVAISEASRVMGLRSEEVGGVVTALTQIIGKNTVSMEELRQQLGERLPSALRLTAKEMGVTTSRFIEMVTKGEVLATDFIPAVTRAMQQMGREAPAAAQSVQAAMERLGNAWLTLKVTIAQSGLLELVARIGEEMTRVINQTTNWINRTKRMSGELGVAPMVAEMQRITQSIQAQQEILADPNIFAPLAEHARTTITALEAQRDALAEQIRVKQQVVEQDEKVRQSADAVAAQDIKNATAKEAEIAALRKASTAWISLSDDIKDVETSLKALRSFDVESLKALQIDPFAADFEQQWNQAETFLLKKQKDLIDKRASVDKGAAAKAIQEAGQSAVELAKAAEDALATQLKREEAMIEASADKRRRAIDEAASAALTVQGPGAVESIAAQRMHDLQTVATDVANELEKLRLDTLEKQAQAREITLKAEIAAAGKNLSAAAAAQEELKNLTAATEQERAEIIKKRADADQKTSKQSADEQIKNARDVNKILKEIEEDRLKSRIDLVDEQIALVEAQVQGEVLTTQDGMTQIQMLHEKKFADIRLLYESQAQAQIDTVNQEVQVTREGTDARVQAEAIAVGQIEKIRQGLATQLETVNIQQQTETQRFLNKQQEQYERFVDKVSSGLASIFEGLLNGTLDLLESFKRMFLRTLSNIIAEAATRAIIVPIITQVIGAVGGFAPGVAGAVSQAIGLGGAITGTGGSGEGSGTGGSGLLGTGREVLGIGLMGGQLFGPQSLIGRGLSFLTNTVTSAAQAIANWINAVKFGTNVATESAIQTSAAMDAAIPGTTPAGPGLGAGAATAGQVLGIAGGLAALGGGIYAALNASNNAARAAYAASAAAGAFAAATAAYGAVTGGALVIAGTTGWTGIGLIAAAVMAVIGTVLNKVIKPAGPSLSVGRPSGLGIVEESGKLGVAGDLGTRVTRREGVTREFASGVQAQMEEGITSAVQGIVKAINAVALDPVKLLGPTNEALKNALNAIRPLNTANAKKMTQDITEQLRFINIAIVGGLLEPVNKAFDQLRDMGTLEQQIERLPGTTAGLVDIFRNMNKQLDEIAGSKNTDVLRQISGVRNQVENFGNRIAGTAAQTAESIVNSIVESFKTQVDPSLAKQITQFAELMNKSLGALASLRSTQQALEGVGLPGGGVGAQIDRLTAATSQAAADISTQIVTTALSDLSTSLDQVLIQPIRVQATTVNSLFTDSLAALSALWTQWHTLADAGIDTTLMQEQYTKLVSGILDTTTKVLDQAFQTGSFSEFLNVLSSIPKAVTDLNPAFARLREIGAAFQQVVGPIAQAMATLEDSMRTTSERVTFSATKIVDLRQAIADAGDSADKALPLYDQLAREIINNANLQIQAIQEIQQAQERALSQVQADIDSLEETLGSFDQQISRTMGDLATSLLDFNDAIGSGDMAKAITAIQSYQQALVSYADLLIKQIQAERQAALDAQQAVIDATQEQIDVVNDAIQAQQKYINTLQDEVSTRQDAVDAIRREIESLTQLRDRVADVTRAGLSPARQAPAIREQLAATQAHLGTVSGDAAIKDLEKLISLNEELKQLGEQTDQLILVKEALDNLNALQDQLNAQLGQAEAKLSPAEAQLETAKAALDAANAQLDTMNAQLDALNAQLKVQQDQLKNLEQSNYWDEQITAIQTALLAQLYEIERWLISVEGDTTWEDQIKAIQQAELDQLQQVERDLQALFLKTVASANAAGLSVNVQQQMLERLRTLNEYNLKLPVPIEVKNFYEAPRAQQGGLVGYASGLYYAQGGMVAPKPSTAALDHVYDSLHVPHQRFAAGGMVPVRLEPGERVFEPPMTRAQQGALMAMNRAFPRQGGGWTVPGRGTGDTMPAWVPPGSFILNRNAAGTSGYQGGGAVSPSSTGPNGASSQPREVHVHIDLRGSVFRSQHDAKEIIRVLDEWARKRGDTRL